MGLALASAGSWSRAFVPADAKRSAGAPCATCWARVVLEPKESLTVTPGWAASKESASVVKGSVSEAAASTVTVPLRSESALDGEEARAEGPALSRAAVVGVAPEPQAARASTTRTRPARAEAACARPPAATRILVTGGLR